MMSESDIFPDVKKKRGERHFTEKDLVVSLLTRVSHIYVNKLDGKERIWKSPPKDWPTHKLGKWRNPTGKEKDSVEVMKQKIEYMFSKLPEEKIEEEKSLLLELSKHKTKNNADFSHDSVCLLRLVDSLSNIPDCTISSYDNPAYNMLVKKVKELLKRKDENLTKVSQAKENNNLLKDSMPPSERKKPKLVESAKNKPRPKKIIQYRPIQPKPKSFPQSSLSSRTFIGNQSPSTSLPHIDFPIALHIQRLDHSTLQDREHLHLNSPLDRNIQPQADIPFQKDISALSYHLNLFNDNRSNPYEFSTSNEPHSCCSKSTVDDESICDMNSLISSHQESIPLSLSDTWTKSSLHKTQDDHDSDLEAILSSIPNFDLEDYLNGSKSIEDL